NMLCGSRSFGPDIKDRATCCHNSVDFARNDRANGLRQLCYKTQMTFTQTHAKIFTCAIRFETDIPDALFTASPFKLVPLWAAPGKYKSKLWIVPKPLHHCQNCTELMRKPQIS